MLKKISCVLFFLIFFPLISYSQTHVCYNKTLIGDYVKKYIHMLYAYKIENVFILMPENESQILYDFLVTEIESVRMIFWRKGYSNVVINEMFKNTTLEPLNLSVNPSIINNTVNIKIKGNFLVKTPLLKEDVINVEQTIILNTINEEGCKIIDIL